MSETKLNIKVPQIVAPALLTITTALAAYALICREQMR